jgi:tetratricopeptide (TPR) repeat protein
MTFSIIHPQEKKSATQVIEDAIETAGIETAVACFNELVAAEDPSLSETELVSLGYKLFRAGKTIEAVEVLKMATQVSPQSPQAYFALARGYRAIGMEDKDLESVEQAFELQDKTLLKSYLEKNAGAMTKTADEIIEGHIEAIGGRSKLLAIKTMVVTYADLNAINRAPFIRRYFQYPHLIRQDHLSAGTIKSTDGNKIWKNDEGVWVEQSNTNDVMIYMPDIYSDFIDYEKKGISYDFIGVEAIDGEILYHIRKTHEDGEKRDTFFSTETGLLVMERRIFFAGKDVKRYFDYRDVEGILMPHMFIVTYKAGLGQHHGGILTDIELNAPLEDGFFPP